MPREDLLWMKEFLQDDLYLINSEKSSAPIITPGIVEIETPEPAFNYLGKAGSEFLILVHYPQDEHINAAHLTSLENILSRKNLVIEDTVIFNMATQPAKDYRGIFDHFQPKKILIMGAGALPIGLDVPEPNSITGTEPKILYTYNFAEMDNDEKKRAFWNQMKNF